MAKKVTDRIEMEGMIEFAIKLLDETYFPKKEFREAHGIVILEALQAGFFFNAQVGTGILLQHDKETKTWSPPLAIGLTGVGAGFSWGIQKKHMVVFLSREQVAKAMSSDYSLRLGLETSLCFIVGGHSQDVTAQVGNKGSAITSGQTTSLGFYVGVDAEGAALAPRTAVNEKFYGQKLEPKQILELQDVPPCEPLERLHEKLHSLETYKAKLVGVDGGL